jgi:hypothetical protein
MSTIYVVKIAHCYKWRCLNLGTIAKDIAHRLPRSTDMDDAELNKIVDELIGYRRWLHKQPEPAGHNSIQLKKIRRPFLEFPHVLLDLVKYDMVRI